MPLPRHGGQTYRSVTCLTVACCNNRQREVQVLAERSGVHKDVGEGAGKITAFEGAGILKVQPQFLVQVDV